MKRFIKPNWTKSILNISATLAEFLGVPNKNATLPILKKELAKNYKNIVFICFDGLGINPIVKNLNKNNILRKNIKQTLVSTFPSTTTNATTSLLTNKLPLEHGWFGWSVYFKVLNKNIDIFLNRDSWTGDEVEIKNSPLAPLDYYFDNANTNYEINTVFPAYVKVKYAERNNVFDSDEKFFEYIKNICNKEAKQFIYAYYSDIDSTMHNFGVESKETKNIMHRISDNVEKLLNETKDTLFIITADHGQIDVKGCLNFYEDKELLNFLKIYPFLDSRTPCFIVKDGKNKEFEDFFTKKYGKDFILYKSENLIKKGYFGNFGDKGHLLGDYIAIGTYTHKTARMTPTLPYFKGHHTSLTEEMEVPLILINS